VTIDRRNWQTGKNFPPKMVESSSVQSVGKNLNEWKLVRGKRYRKAMGWISGRTNPTLGLCVQFPTELESFVEGKSQILHSMLVL
jgi:hypothetical protein